MSENAFFPNMSPSLRTGPPIVITIGNSAAIKFGHNFLLGGPIDLESTRLNRILQDLSSDTLLEHIYINMRPKYRTWCIWPYLGAYLSAPNMVKWGVPEKVLQNAVQTRWS